MKIFVISLKSALDRRESITQQFLDINIKFQFFEAVNGKAEIHPLFEKYNEKERLKKKGYPLSKGELGCFASHYLLWEKCVELDETLIIIEDDAQLNFNFIDFYKNYKMFSSKYEYLRLFVNDRKRKFELIAQISNLDVVRYLRGPAATRAYIITPAAARKFISSAQNWTLAVDNYMDQFWLNKVICMGIMPGVVENETPFGSTIGDTVETSKKRDLQSILTREYNNLKDSLSRMIFNLKLKLPI